MPFSLAAASPQLLVRRRRTGADLRSGLALGVLVLAGVMTVAWLGFLLYAAVRLVVVLV